MFAFGREVAARWGVEGEGDSWDWGRWIMARPPEYCRWPTRHVNRMGGEKWRCYNIDRRARIIRGRGI
jgi:hypothetical protein